MLVSVYQCGGNDEMLRSNASENTTVRAKELTAP